MKERPILFSGAMVRAILEGRKVQTRRVMSPQPTESRVIKSWNWKTWGWSGRPMRSMLDAGPYGQPGDRLWVRETWALEDCGDDGQRIIWQADRAARWLMHGADSEVYYLPSDYSPSRWRPSIHIPRGFSRLTLEVTEVRVQRLQEISEEDARAEGVEASVDRIDGHYTVTAREQFEALWDSINGERPGCSWESNPWVWCVSFRRVA